MAALAAAERLGPLPSLPYPAVLELERVVSAACLVSYEGNRYSVPAGLHGQRVLVRRRLGSNQVELVSQGGSVIAAHRLAPAGQGALQRHPAHQVELEQVVLASLTSKRPCRRKANRPPGEAALAAAAALAGEPRDVVVSLEQYGRYAAVAHAMIEHRLNQISSDSSSVSSWPSSSATAQTWPGVPTSRSR